MTIYSDQVEIFGKSCYNCTSCCADKEEDNKFDAFDSVYTTYWCSKEKRIIMKRIAVLNSKCSEWEVRKEEE